MQNLPQLLYRAAQLRELDRIAISDYGIPGAALMANAGAAAFNVLREFWPQAGRISVVCGLGNNAGDGFVLARLARENGLDVTVLQLGDIARLRGDALAARAAFIESRGVPRAFTPDALNTAELLVDALLGTGLDREISAEWRIAIEAMNASGIPIFALDIPSGLDADSGQVLGVAIRAQATISFIGLKQGMFTGQARNYCGKIFFADLGLPAELFHRIPVSAARINLGSMPEPIPRPRAAHKGNNGHVLVIGGDHGMAGAIRLAGEAAARIGAGLVTIATRPDHVSGINAARPELLCRGIKSAGQLLPLIEAANVIAIGPGLGRTSWAVELFARVLDSPVPLVIDADGLNLLALEPVRCANWILTPHPGEAARLLGCSIAEIEKDRFAAVAELHKRYGGAVVLKGAGTLVWAGTGPIAVCDAGNPGMASGGMGDVLTGVIAGLLAQGSGLEAAAQLGVCLHAAAGDRAAREGERGMLASDLFPHLRYGVNFG
ncbi:MAG: NAD(P)H-hydrate dehydratase [Gammaproteobacteria bacterium]